VFVPILHAGFGLLERLLWVMPEAYVGHIGLYRDEVTLRPVKLLFYYCRLPAALTQSDVVLLDPMLATGRSAMEAATLLKAHRVRAAFNLFAGLPARSESSNCEPRIRISRAQ